MIVMAAVICVFYLAYRAIFTLNLSTNYAIFASVFLYVGECFGIMNLLLYFLQVWEIDEPPAEPVLEGRTVDVLVPTYNEDPQLLRATLEACIRMDYPHKTYVLDDGRRPEVETLARELGVIYISRADNRHAKAGNLNNALEQTDGEFVVVLDADHVPEPHFITRLIGYFRDDGVAFVQTPHAFYNFDSFQARLDHKNRRYWEEGDLFYRVIQPGRNKWNAPIFAGSAAMFRRGALKEIGYIATETITEDLHTGLRLHSRGWKSIAISERLIAGQAPPDITTFHSQRLRWGEGNLSIMAYDNPLFMRGLNLPQRFCYFGSMIHWASGLFKLAIYLTPILMLFSGVPPVREFSWNLIVVTLTYLFFSLYTMKVVSNGYGSIVNSELFSMANFWTQCKATFRAIFRRRRQSFVVTKKRGPQAKSIWPFVRPQTYLIILSVLAMFWGWLRLSLDLNPVRAVVRFMQRVNLDITKRFADNISSLIDGTLLNHPLVVGWGISDDYFKPVVPTIWCLIFFWLAYKVTQRAFWPADRRFTTRHQVHLPVEYEVNTPQGQTVHYGVTVDLNDSGMALVAYEELPLNAVLRFVLRGAGEVVKVRGEIRSSTKVSRGSSAAGYRYGIQFQELTSPQIDSINRMCMHYAVPLMFEEYQKGNQDTFWNRIKLWQSRGMAQRRQARRNPFAIPIIVNSGASEETMMYGATEDVSRVATATLFDNEIPVGSNVGFMLATPMGDVRGNATVIRSQPRMIAGRPYYRTVLEYNDFDGQGRTTIQSLVNPTENSPLAATLKPDRKTLLPNMRVPIIIGLLIAIPLILAQMGLIFPFMYRDDQMLRQMIDKVDAGNRLSPEEDKQYRRILNETLKDEHPTTDRLVLLMAIGNKLGEKSDIEQVTQYIALRDLRNVRLSKALVDAYLNTQKHKEAEATYARLQALKEQGRLSELSDAEYRQLKEAGARIAFKAGRYEESIKRFDDILATWPDYANDPAFIKEFAGVCLTGGNPDRAIALLKSIPLDTDGRELLIAAYTQRKDFTDAEREANILENEAQNSPELLAKALRIKADIEGERRDYTQQEAILERIRQRQGANPDPDILVRLALAQNAQKKYDQALETIAGLFENKDYRPGAVDAFVNAASQVKGVERAKPEYNAEKANRIRGYAVRMHDDAMKSGRDDPDFAVYLTRLGWVLQRLGESERSSDLVKKALAILPNNAQFRQQLAGILLQAGKTEAALIALGGANTPEARELMIGIHLENREFDKALSLARALADSDRNNWDHERRVADILSWKGDASSLAKAIEIYERHLIAFPNDIDAEARVAEITLWAKFFGDAVAKYQRLLEPESRFKTNAARYGDGFINAASSAKDLTPSQIKIAEQLADQRVGLATADPLTAARLAWIMTRVKDRERAEKLLAKVVIPKDAKPEVRKEIADVLAGAGMYQEAIRLMDNPRTDKERVELARLYAGAKEWPQAISQLTLVIAGNAADAVTMKEARVLLADVLGYKGEHQKAIDMFAKLRMDYPEDPSLPIREAEVTLWAKDYAKALPMFQGLYDRNPTDPRVWHGFVSTVAAMGANNTMLKVKPIVPDWAIGTARRVAERVLLLPDLNDPQLLSRLSQAMYYVNDREKADEFIKRALELNSKDPVVRRELASTLVTLKRFGEALEQYNTFELSPDDRRRLIDIATAGENLDLAARQARILVDLDPTNRADRKLLADVLAWRGDFAEAIALYEQMLRNQPKDIDLMVQIATFWDWSRNYPEALIRYSKLLPLRPDDVYLGFIDAASSSPTLTPTQINQALDIYERYKDKLTDAARLARLAWIMIRINRGENADLLLDRALALDTSDPEVRKELAGALAGRDRVAEAVKLFTSVENDLTFNERITYAILLTSLGTEASIEEAERQFRRLINSGFRPRDEELRVRYAEMLMWGGKYDKRRYAQAQKEFESLARDYPKDPRFPIRIAQCILWSGRYGEARPRFQALLDAPPLSDRKLQRDVWMGFADSVAGEVGEVLRRAGLEDEQPEKYLNEFFTDKLRKTIVREYQRADQMKPDTPDRVTERYLNELKYYSESLSRLGLALGLMGDRARSREMFEKAISLNRLDREIWQRYAQTLTLTRDFVRARAIYDPLIAGRVPDELPR
jgi:cellulose synthase/poly-beta-1,6-N-acetylglucosamine synthase-like glycosyltransferase/tetratricopeptide (TPR) repeat protein